MEIGLCALIMAKGAHTRGAVVEGGALAAVVVDTVKEMNVRADASLIVTVEQAEGEYQGSPESECLLRRMFGNHIPTFYNSSSVSLSGVRTCYDVLSDYMQWPIYLNFF